MIPACAWISAPLRCPLLPIAIEQGSPTQGLLSRGLDSLRLAALGWGGEREDETPYWMPPQGMVYFLTPACEGFVTQKPAGLSWLLGAILTSVRTTS